MSESRADSFLDEPSLLTTKRAASEDSKVAADAKKMKSSHEGSTKPDTRPGNDALKIPSLDKPVILEERDGDIEFRVVYNDGTTDSMILLTGLKYLFQKQLPLTPKDYITRLVFDQTIKSIVMVKKPLEIMGAISYREFRARQFAEIVFCAVASDEQVRGYGAHLVAHLKDYVKATSPVMEILTCADNYTIRFFQKQGFTEEITLDKSIWMGHIQDYEGGTPMLCSMAPGVHYLEIEPMPLKLEGMIPTTLVSQPKTQRSPDIMTQTPTPGGATNQEGSTGN